MSKFGLRCDTQSTVQYSYLCFQLMIWQCSILWFRNPWNRLRQWYAVNSCYLLSTNSSSCCQLSTSRKQKRPDHFYKMTKQLMTTVNTIMYHTLHIILSSVTDSHTSVSIKHLICYRYHKKNSALWCT